MNRRPDWLLTAVVWALLVAALAAIVLVSCAPPAGAATLTHADGTRVALLACGGLIAIHAVVAYLAVTAWLDARRLERQLWETRREYAEWLDDEDGDR